MVDTPTLATTLDVFLTALHTQRRTAATQHAYRADLQHASTVLTAPLTELTATQLRDYLEQGAGAQASKVRALAALRSFFAWAVAQGYLVTNPVAAVTLAPVPRSAPTVIPADDLAALDQAIDAEDQPYRFVLTVVRETGMKVRDLLDRTIADASSDPLLAAYATSERAGAAADAPLIVSSHRRRLSYHAVRAHWAQLCHQAGFVDAEGNPQYTLHQLRQARQRDAQAQATARAAARLGYHAE